ncbi:hypothetical protein EW146_g4119 [Bondarzewia mesenterica]|uniref:YEATS domain-containing protein n=1 Tax=Bondarzewia mesenterica TaxID=1095465 RepID=A0A4S4LVI4_9AGAM|nr:hypothetical protein EW146_g4119 [Bondarzewia mesenterica]
MSSPPDGQGEQHVRKKRKISDRKTSSFDGGDNYAAHRQVILEELDLELDIRRRLHDAIESRITWALLLQESLEKQFYHDQETVQIQREDAFHNAAIEALEVIEAPCIPFLSREQPRLTPPAPPISTSVHPTHPHTLPSGSDSRPHARHTRQRPLTNLVRPVQSGGTKLLFLRNTNTVPPTLAKLACLDCSRTDFPSVQGLLNHCRLRHARDFGSHDECIRNCAVQVPDDEQEWVQRNGIELAEASLPSLRSLFEIAVAGRGTEAMFARNEVEREKVQSEEIVGATDGGASPGVKRSTHLSRTLGHHIDTPALAPFLGRTPRRRGINIQDEDGIADIFEVVGDIRSTAKPRWRMPYTHRSKARAALDAVPPEAGESDETSRVASSLESAVPRPLLETAKASAGSRFHVIARVTVSDHSLWLPPNRRTPALQEHTHSWMLSVGSPSYHHAACQSLHISAFLAKMRVTCLTDPPPSTLADPIIVTSPPFAVASTTDRPFLARLTLTLVGSQNPPMEIEHWVELDSLKSTNPVLGDEQVLDAELDRHTELLPVTASERAGGGDRVTLLMPSHSGVISREKTFPQLPSGLRRGSGIARVAFSGDRASPLSADAKSRNPPQVPYRLMSSPAQFRGLVPGRRKAIEWGRARALREAYEEHVQTSSTPGAEGLIPLTTGDVFCWLEDEGLFVRPARPQTETECANAEKDPGLSSGRTASTILDAFCPACGLALVAHAPSVKQETRQFCSVLSSDLSSDTSLRLPVVNISSIIDSIPPRAPVTSSSGVGPVVTTISRFARVLLDSADPRLMEAVRSLVDPLELSCFRSRRQSFCAPTLPSAPIGSEEDATVAPLALLSLVLRVFARRLVGGAVAALQRDIASGRAGGRGKERRVRTVLAPAHVAREVHARSGGASREGYQSLFFSVAELGSSIGPRTHPWVLSKQVIMDTRQSACVPGTVVKVEDEEG